MYYTCRNIHNKKVVSIVIAKMAIGPAMNNINCSYSRKQTP